MILSTQGIVLKVFPYSNTSVICNVFTQIKGKMSFIAKGIQKPKNPTISILQPFNILEIQYYYKDGRNIQMIKEVDIDQSFCSIRNNLSSILFGGAILNISNRILEPNYENDIIFRLISKSLGNLGSNKNNNKKYFLFFLFHFVKQLGFMPNIVQCHLCNRKLSSNTFLDDRSHLLICEACHMLSSNNNSINRQMLDCIILINHTFIDHIKDIAIKDDMLKQSYIFLQDFISYHIKSIESIPSFKIMDGVYHVT